VGKRDTVGRAAPPARGPTADKGAIPENDATINRNTGLPLRRARDKDTPTRATVGVPRVRRRHGRGQVRYRPGCDYAVVFAGHAVGHYRKLDRALDAARRLARNGRMAIVHIRFAVTSIEVTDPGCQVAWHPLRNVREQ